MMKAVLATLSLGYVVFVAACAVAPETNDKYAPTPAMAKAVGSDMETIGTGYTVFQRQCMQCHEKRVPHERVGDSWKHVSEAMAANAGVSSEEEAALLKYIEGASTVAP